MKRVRNIVTVLHRDFQSLIFFDNDCTYEKDNDCMLWEEQGHSFPDPCRCRECIALTSTLSLQSSTQPKLLLLSLFSITSSSSTISSVVRFTLESWLLLRTGSADVDCLARLASRNSERVLVRLLLLLALARLLPICLISEWVLVLCCCTGTPILPPSVRKWVSHTTWPQGKATTGDSTVSKQMEHSAETKISWQPWEHWYWGGHSNGMLCGGLGPTTRRRVLSTFWWRCLEFVGATAVCTAMHVGHLTPTPTLLSFEEAFRLCDCLIFQCYNAWQTVSQW